MPNDDILEYVVLSKIKDNFKIEKFEPTIALTKDHFSNSLAAFPVYFGKKWEFSILSILAETAILTKQNVDVCKNVLDAIGASRGRRRSLRDILRSFLGDKYNTSISNFSLIGHINENTMSGMVTLAININVASSIVNPELYLVRNNTYDGLELFESLLKENILPIISVDHFGAPANTY